MEQRLIELLQQARNLHATDIHFSIRNQDVQVEMRTNSVMKSISSKPDDLRLFRTLQYLADLDVSDVLRPQTGRFEVDLDGQRLALRFAVMHSLFVTSGVLRILNGHMDWLLQDCCCDKKQIEPLRKALRHASGLCLISGPTGSGKTTTLYAMLNELKEAKIFTLEDPIEIYSDRYVQIQINERQNLGYDEGISQLLRHDPDVIMIGEIRDSIAAKMAVRCALSGHLVLSSLHAASAISAIERMKELGVKESQLLDMLVCVSNQRLISLKNKKGKTCVYETLQDEGLQWVRSEGKLPESFISLRITLESMAQKNLITKQTLETL